MELNTLKTSGLLRKLNRVIRNCMFFDSFPSASARFLPFLILDHSPAVLLILELQKSKPKPFRFANFHTIKKNFLLTVKDVWDNNIQGHAMFSVVTKMKKLKHLQRKLNSINGNVFEKVKTLKVELEKV